MTLSTVSNLSPPRHRQHRQHRDAAGRVQPPRDERVLPARGDLRQRLPDPEQHQHADRTRVRLRQPREHAVVQPGGPALLRRPHDRRPGGHTALRHHPAQ